MHLIDYRKLADDLASGRVTELDSLKYYAAGTVLAIVSQQAAAAGGINAPALFALDCVILLVASLAGVAFCWQKNGGSAGADFVLRMICLSVPVTIRMMLLYVLFSAAMYFSTGVFYSGFFADPYRAQVIVSYAAFVGLLVYVWSTMGEAVRRAATAAERSAQ